MNNNKWYDPKKLNPTKVMKFKIQQRNYARNKRGKR